MNRPGLERLLSTDFELNVKNYYNGKVIEDIGICSHLIGSVNGCCFSCGAVVRSC